MKKYPVGAGMVVFKEVDNCLKVLVLKCYNGQWDLPKGALDVGESLFDCAVRELEEEAGIDQIGFVWGKSSISLDHLTFYTCFTEQDPVIRPNPTNGYIEHERAVWMDPHRAYKSLPSYLKPAVKWAVGQLIF